MLMTLRLTLRQLMQHEDLNFLITNRIPRRLLTLFMGWFSKIEQPLVRDLSIGVWRRFAELNLDEAKKTAFQSLHDCFIRELKPGARPINAARDVLTSPCDGIIGACGPIDGVRVFQAKGFPYALNDLLGDAELARRYRGGCYATIRITASMYHRFHAPLDCRVKQVDYISGDTWNVNPIALKRVEALFCKNERAVVHVKHELSANDILLVPVAAVLVASIRLHFLDVLLHLRYRGPNKMECDAFFRKGDEMGWFQHGSTIIVLAPKGFQMCESSCDGTRIRVGQSLMRRIDVVRAPAAADRKQDQGVAM